MSVWKTAGKVRMTPKGVWDSLTSYEILDTVTSEDLSTHYVAKQDVPVGTLLTNTDYWEVVVDVADAVENICLVQDEQPTAPNNRIWIPETGGTEVEVPTMDEFNEVKSAFEADLEFINNDVEKISEIININVNETIVGDVPASLDTITVFDGLRLKSGHTYNYSLTLASASDQPVYFHIWNGDALASSVTVAAGTTTKSKTFVADSSFSARLSINDVNRAVSYTAIIQDADTTTKFDDLAAEDDAIYDTAISVGTITNSKYIAGTTGLDTGDANSAVTGFIPVIGGLTISTDNIYITSNRSVYAYDSNKNPLMALATDSNDTKRTITLGENVAYIRITSKKDVTPVAKYVNSVAKTRINNLVDSCKCLTSASGNPVMEYNTKPAHVEDFIIHGSNRAVHPTPENRIDVYSVNPPYIYQGGKNVLRNDLANKTSHEVTFTLNTDKSFSVSGAADAAFSIKLGEAILLKGHTYTLSGMFVNTTGCYMYIVTQNGSPTDTGSGVTFKAQSTQTAAVYIYISASFDDTKTVYPQVEIGNKVTTYEQYYGNTSVLTGVNVNPLDTIQKVSGDWVHKKVSTTIITLDGDEDIRTTGKGYYVPLTTWDWDGIPYADAICNSFTLASSWDDVATGRHDDTFIVYKNDIWSNARVAFFSTRWNSLEEFTAWLALNPITFAYEDGGGTTYDTLSGDAENALNDIRTYESSTVLCAESSLFLEGEFTFKAENIAEKYAESKDHYKRPIVTIIDDDGQTAAYTVLKPLCDSKGIKCTIALITGNIGNNPAYMTLAQVFDLKAAGYDLVSHTKTHTNSIFSKHEANFSLVTDEAVYNEFKESRDWIVKYGLDDKVIVYPHGNFPEFFDETCNNPDPNDSYVCGAYNQVTRYTKIAREAGYSYGVNSTGGIMEGNSAFNDMYIPRAEVIDADGLDYWKSQIDKVVSTNGWMVIITHMWSTATTAEFLGDVIDYALSKGCEFKTFADAIKEKHNSVAVGMYDDAHSLYIGADGRR